jgi:hypothetical protein
MPPSYIERIRASDVMPVAQLPIDKRKGPGLLLPGGCYLSDWGAHILQLTHCLVHTWAIVDYARYPNC